VARDVALRTEQGARRRQGVKACATESTSMSNISELSPPEVTYLSNLAPARRVMLVAVMLGGTASQGIVFGAIPPLLGALPAN
jgi:hypothetical protein